ncbi:TadE/TadG family type IV pilus assembly protein [Actinomyces wuliandei]|uniref:TadE/TadG family type IV pilus assembly protein n=1 Tax=Actinomyces wuliandei TaxID=2057743 RepID=UPI001FA9B0F1|nr:TadE family protein [Actinomyces wuliandei]
MPDTPGAQAVQSRHRLRVLAGRLRGQEGASSVELLVFFPLLMLIILLTVQVALSWYGNEVAMMTAREVAREVRNGGEVASAREDGRRYAHQVGGRALTDLDVHVSVTGQEVVVNVEGEAMTVLAGLVPRVHASVTAQRETFREDL